ncbi:Biotin carboxyl carrier protein [Variovorax sp. CF079]|uniref:hypothetical protein n=1 Tax=Variovorax sp. CF079 TaxID=1882774 RepID=UPI00088ED4FB|nr:hypothetical protein [Variovorax sp. CF079]SDD50703.1 Biotin carboxyl carrier protein [Variovorax sp. CF079]
MMTPSELQRVVLSLQSCDVTYFECEGPQGVFRIRFSRQPGTQAPSDGDLTSTEQAPLGASGASTCLKSPGIGIFCVKHPLTGLEAMREGGGVKKGQILAFLRAGEMLTPILSDRDAVAIRQASAEGALVGYGDVLFDLS